ncbi:GNAT family N-acetyltransferase [Metabacillus sp. RGM 3146]|uniref:GNAT family N-acetyltransferase n=1 Tax=Metabacillus sp. RGM 3146 TaxID=3401092 RepID=UPI003B9AED45
MLEIKQIDPEKTFEIRQRILRPNQTIEECKYEFNDHPDSFHAGAYVEQKLISIASFSKEQHPDVPGENHYRLRGMATMPGYRNRKAGSSVLFYAESILKSRNVSTWWCNARESVSGYYEKLGCFAIGELFEIKPIGMHRLMYKILED